ncbi:hypothetical protein LCGC14_1779250 [marine sediment metagenome]|uniref:Uncharacterized protein n=1 Tax=marine sediment metagenome TaxID=412755 RepID=A0A0F9HIH0_9ZZZZ
MIWETKYTYLPKYEFTSTSKHGDRFKRKDTRQLRVARMETPCDNISDMKHLILLSHHLDVPVHYSFDEPQTAFIEIIAKESI